MIGIKVKNSYWEKALLDLLNEKAETYHQSKEYAVIVTDTPVSHSKSICICLGCPGGKYQLPLPFKKSALELLLAKIPSSYQNPLFIWHSDCRQLENKKTKKKIQLTEKEAAVIDFLSQCPKKEASKTDLLRHVWQYTNDADTHTVETTLYTLRQKLENDADTLITSTKAGYKLV